MCTGLTQSFLEHTDPDKVLKPAAKIVSDDSSSNHISARHVHSPSISNTTIESTIPPASINNSVLLMTNRPAPPLTSNGYNDIYSSDSEEDPVFEEMVDINYIVKTVNTYIVEPHKLKIVRPPTKLLKKQKKIRGRTRIATIQRAQSDTTTSARFLSTALYSVPQAITRANSHRIAMYNKKDTDFCEDSGASEDMFPDYPTFKTYHRITNRYETLGDTTNLPIEGIGTTVYTLNGHTILTHNALHIQALRGPLYSLCKHHQRPGYGVYSSYKDGSYLFFPEFILQV